MNPSTKFFSVIFAAGTAGVAAFSFANSTYSAGLRGDVILGAGTALAVLGLAVYDYSRRVQPLTLPARVLRPVLPAASRAPAYGSKHVRKDRVAA